MLDRRTTSEEAGSRVFLCATPSVAGVVFVDFDLGVPKGRIRALIPARSGSKSVKDKNLYRLRGFSLLEYSVAAARCVLPMEDVWVSTDSEAYAKVAVAAGASVKFLRPSDLARDESTDLDVFRHALEFERANELNVADMWLHLRPTTPMRDPDVLVDAIRTFLRHPGKPTAMRSVHKTDLPVLKWCLSTGDGFLTDLYGRTDLDRINGPRQSYEPVFIPNGYIDIIRAETILGEGLLHGSRCLSFVTPVVSDIDFEADLERMVSDDVRAAKLEAWLSMHKHP